MWIKLSNLWLNVFLAYALGSDKYANFLIFLWLVIMFMWLMVQYVFCLCFRL
jgi:hypothetical protein